jgi:hypothetical protein
LSQFDAFTITRNVSHDLYQFHKVALDITPPTPPNSRGGSDFIYSISLEKWYYCPHRSDFKLKYFSRDFPPQIVDRTAPLFCITNLEDLAEKQQIAEAIFAETLPIAEKLLHNYSNQPN